MSASPVDRPLDASLVLVRHGESTWVAEGRFQGGADPPLSALGRRQADLVARRLGGPSGGPPLPLPRTRPVGVWHSPLDRAAEGARRISSAWDPALPLHADERLVEVRQGAWEGLTQDEVRARYGAELDGWRLDPMHHHAPGGESLAEVAARASGALTDIVAALGTTRDDGTPRSPVLGYDRQPRDRPWAVAVAHDGVLRVTLLVALGLSLERFWSFPFALAGITVLELRPGRTTLRAHNLDEHLAPLAAAANEAWRDRAGAM